METTTSLDDYVAAEVRAEMGRQKMSNAALARELKVSDFWIGRRLNGEVAFEVGELQKVADVLGVPIWQFLQTKHEEMDRRHGPVMDAMLAGAGKTSKSRGSHPGQMELS